MQNHAQLSAGHMQIAMGAIADPAAAAKPLEDYAVPCPACGKPVPFEPRSRYRQRKVAALEKVLEQLKRAPQADSVGGQMVAYAQGACTRFLGLLRTDCPLEDVRQEAGKIRLVMESLPFGKGHPARAVVEEVCSIAASDIGQWKNLPEAPVDDVELKRQEFLKALGALGGAAPAQAPAKAATAAAPKRRRLALPLIILAVLLFVAWKTGLFDSLAASLSGSE